MEHLSPMLRKQLEIDGLCFSCREPLNQKEKYICHHCRVEFQIIQIQNDIDDLKAKTKRLRADIDVSKKEVIDDE